MGEVAVVVGAAGGIGREVARRLAQDPAISGMVLADLDHERLETVRTDLGETTCAIRLAPVDLADPQSIEALVAGSAEATRIALVAGIFHASPSLTVTPGELTRVIAVNTIGVFLVARGYAREMGSRTGGAICAVASIGARVPRIRQAAYGASKAAMRQALRVLALETVASGVRINFVSPGPTDTPMLRQLAVEYDLAEFAGGSADTYRAPIPDGRVATPQDVAAAVAFLLSPDSSHVFMHDLYLDGGESLGL